MALLFIIGADLVLAGDNAVVIAMAARNLPAKWKRMAIVWGTLGAIVARVILVLFVSQLLAVPGVALAGGLVLYVIAWRLLKPAVADRADAGGAAVVGFWGAMKTIIVADVVMALDNILAIAAAARNDALLIILGLVISIPIVMGGSVLILKALGRYPWLEVIGAGLLAIIAGRIILDDRWVSGLWDAAAALEWSLVIAVGVAVTAAARAYWKRR